MTADARLIGAHTILTRGERGPSTKLECGVWKVKDPELSTHSMAILRTGSAGDARHMTVRDRQFVRTDYYL